MGQVEFCAAARFVFTGKYFEVRMSAVIGCRCDVPGNAHIRWDQMPVLAQIDVIGPTVPSITRVSSRMRRRSSLRWALRTNEGQRLWRLQGGRSAERVAGDAGLFAGLFVGLVGNFREQAWIRLQRLNDAVRRRLERERTRERVAFYVQNVVIVYVCIERLVILIKRPPSALEIAARDCLQIFLLLSCTADNVKSLSQAQNLAVY